MPLDGVLGARGSHTVRFLLFVATVLPNSKRFGSGLTENSSSFAGPKLALAQDQHPPKLGCHSSRMRQPARVRWSPQDKEG